MAGRGKIPASYGDRNVPMRRPGEPAAVTSQTLLQLLNTLQFDPIVDEKILEKCVEIYDTLASSKDGYLPTVQILHSTCLSDARYCRRVAMLGASLEKNSAANFLPFRMRILTHLQENFQNKEKFSKKNEDLLHNAVQLHGEIYLYLQVAGEPLKVLGSPLLDYLFLVLNSSSQAACQLILLQIAINGENLIKSIGSLEFGNFLVALRRTMIKPDISSSSRTRLLLSLEIANKSFIFSEGSTKSFYSNELGDDFTILESRILGVPFRPTGKVKSSPPVPDVTEKLAPVSVSSTSQKAPAGFMSEVEAVRDRMRAKGLLPRHNATTKSIESKVDKDDDFYGIQIPKYDRKTDFISVKNAKSTPLPDDDNWN